MFLGEALVSWSSKCQTTVSRSSAEAEYRGIANAVAECTWLRHLLSELHCGVSKATVAYCDNISSVYMSRNPVHHRRTKHIELDIHFVREKVALGELRVLQIPSGRQFADIFTKGLPTALFEDFRSSLCIGETTAKTAGGVGVANCIARRTRSSPDRRVALVRAMRAPRRARHADRVHRAHDAP